MTEVKGRVNAIRRWAVMSIWQCWGCFCFLFLFSVLASASKWVGTCFSKAYFLTGMIPPWCVDIHSILYFLSNQNSDEPDPGVSSSLFHSLFLSRHVRELPLWENTFQFWSLIHSGTLSWAGWCVTGQCVWTLVIILSTGKFCGWCFTFDWLP